MRTAKYATNNAASRWFVFMFIIQAASSSSYSNSFVIDKSYSLRRQRMQCDRRLPPIVKRNLSRQERKYCAVSFFIVGSHYQPNNSEHTAPTMFPRTIPSKNLTRLKLKNCHCLLSRGCAWTFRLTMKQITWVTYLIFQIIFRFAEATCSWM